MTDTINEARRPPAVPAKPATFPTLAPRTEKVSTKHFGTVMVVELPIPVTQMLFERYGNQKDRRFANALICECVTGEHGERFTMAMLDALPSRAMFDYGVMVQAATRVNALSEDAAEKPSPLP